jgi:hypothetical protein
MMDRSSRFISLSGWSGIAAGVCALVGGWFAYGVIKGDQGNTSLRNYIDTMQTGGISLREFMGSRLLFIAACTLSAALFFAFIFTYRRSVKKGIRIWDSTSQRLLINLAFPLITGGIFLLKMIDLGIYGLIAPGCLIFYGLALVNAGKYTLGEVRYLGYVQVLLGIINLSFIGQGLYFWILGFGATHIIYGILMWWKYERSE